MLRKEFARKLSDTFLSKDRPSIIYLAADGEWNFLCVDDSGKNLQIYLTKNCVNALKNSPKISDYLDQICSLERRSYLLLDEENGALAIKNYFTQLNSNIE